MSVDDPLLAATPLRNFDHVSISLLVEVETENGWVNFEGFILDARFLAVLQKALADASSLCGYGAGTDCLETPPVERTGGDTCIQKTGIAQDFGTFDTPDAFSSSHHQTFSTVQRLLCQQIIRHWMNARVRNIRAGRIPSIPALARPNHRHKETPNAT